MKSQTLGSSLLVAGTSIGAGMLALPLVSALTGLGWGVTLMFLMWGLSTYGGLLIAEACRACPEADNLHGVMGRLMGPVGQGVAIVAMLFLYYSLCAAYISGGATVLANLLAREGIHLPFRITATAVVLAVAVLVVTGTRVVDVVNRVMFLLMLVLLFYIVLVLLPKIRFDHLALVDGHSVGVLLAALPVLYTSFGYHCAVPTVVQYVKGAPHRFRYALIGGSALPFSIYVVWMAVVIGVVSAPVIVAMVNSPESVTLLMDAIGNHAGTASFDYLIGAFAAFALGTSFLGVALGLFDYLADVFGRSHGLRGRIETIILTLLIPLLAAIFMPGSFVTALGYAAVALVILAVFIPVALVWKVRKLHMPEPYQVAGGVPALALAVMVGALVIVAQFGVVIGLLPSIG